MAEGVDYSYDRPSPKGLVNAGKVFVVRYGAKGKSTKWLTQAEVNALKTVGLDIVANVEETASAFRGAMAGAEHAASGDAFFKALGMGPDRPIYFSVDWDAQPTDWPAIDAAVAAAAGVIGSGRVGVYGSYATIRHVQAIGVASWFWQTYAWSGGQWAPGTHLQQYKNGVTTGGGATDLDRSMTADYGQWGASVPTSQNGWTVAAAAQQDNGLYAGVAFPNGALAGDVAWVFRWLIQQLDYWVEPIIPGDCWGWFVKPVAGQTTGYSNHSSGTAMDYNAPLHPLDTEGTFDAAQVSKIHQILAELDGVVRWGGDYSGRKDPMHFEIVKDAAAVKAVRLKLEDDVAAADVWTQDVIKNPKQRTDSPDHVPAGVNVNTQAGYALGDLWQLVYNQRDALAAMGATLVELQEQVAAMSVEPAPAVDVDALAASLLRQVLSPPTA